jgi:RNA polymerase sigma factor (sigma-70 family)
MDSEIVRDASVAHPLDDPWPPFLDETRSGDAKTRERGLVAFFEFLQRLAAAYPPRAFRNLQRADQEDVLSKVYLRCSRGSLLTYRNRGTPFSAWLSVVIRNMALDWIDQHRETVELPENLVAKDAPADSVGLGDVSDEALRDCLGRAPEHYRQVAEYLAEGLKPREILRLLGWPKGWTNQRMGTLCRDVLRSLRHCLEQRWGRSAAAEGDT